jgi:hypothetical protein
MYQEHLAQWVEYYQRQIDEDLDDIMDAYLCGDRSLDELAGLVKGVAPHKVCALLMMAIKRLSEIPGGA